LNVTRYVIRSYGTIFMRHRATTFTFLGFLIRWIKNNLPSVYILIAATNQKNACNL